MLEARSVEGQHFGNTTPLRKARTAAPASRARLALACSIAVHAAAAFLTAALQPVQPSTNSAEEAVALMIETPPEAAPQPAGVLPTPAAAESLVPALPLTTEAPPVADPVPEVLPAPAEPPTPAPAQDAASPIAEATPEPQPTPTLEIAPIPPEPPALALPVPAVPSTPQQATPPAPPTPPPPAPPRPAPRTRPAQAPRPVPPSASAAPLAQSLAPSPAPPPGQAATAAPAAVEASSGWRTALTNWLQSHKTYPDQARRRAEEGTAVVRFSVGRDGQVLAVTLVRSSGSTTLDEAAQGMFRGARMPPFTADMLQAETTVTVPIRYRLEQ